MSVLGRFRSAQIIASYGSVILVVEDLYGEYARKVSRRLPLSARGIFIRPMSFARSCLASLLPVRIVIVYKDTEGAITCMVLKEFPEMEVLGITESIVHDSVVECIAKLPKLKVVSLAGSALPVGSVEKLKSMRRLEELNLGGASEAEEGQAE
ncbi:MAG: hypothetical protein AAF266_03440 [Planctomycetota bacterium]